jgi:hypothetical protein
MSKPVAGVAIAFRWLFVIRGARKPLLFAAMSIIADASAAVPVVFTAIPCPYPIFVLSVNIATMANESKFFLFISIYILM